MGYIACNTAMKTVTAKGLNRLNKAVKKTLHIAGFSDKCQYILKWLSKHFSQSELHTSKIQQGKCFQYIFKIASKPNFWHLIRLIENVFKFY